MTAILSVFWRICLFRSGPDAVPANSALLGLVILANAVVGITAWAIQSSIAPSAPPSETADVVIVSGLLSVVTVVTVSLACTSGLVWLILNLMGFSARLVQTLTALFGSDVLITTVATLLIFATTLISTDLAQITSLFAMFWAIGVFGFILHRALEISIGFGIVGAIFVVIFTTALTFTMTTPTV